MEFPSAKDLDFDIDDLDVPEGMAVSVFPPIQEHLQDPMWFDQVGRDPIDQRKIFKLSSREGLKAKLAEVLEEWPRYGPAVYEKAARQGRVDVIEVLLELGAESDPKTMRQQEGEDDEDVPLLEIEPAYLVAIQEGHLDIVKLLVERGGVPIDYEDEEDGRIAIPYAASNGHVDIALYLLDHGASITFEREGDNVGDLSCAVRSGQVAIVKAILENQQATARGLEIETSNLPTAAYSGNAAMVRFVLESDCFGIKDPDAGLAGQGKPELSAEQEELVRGSLFHAVGKGSLESVKLLLKQLTATRADGSFEPFKLEEGEQTNIFNATEDALEQADIPELFEVLWDTVLHQPPGNDELIQQKVSIPVEERLNRRLISACTCGRRGIVELLLEKYRADINHVSHKYFSTPLGRAAASSLYPLPGRLEVVEYLCRCSSDLDMDLSAFCEYSNGETALALATKEAHRAARQNPELAEMVRLLLKYGGPVDEVSSELRQRCDEAELNEKIEVHVLLMEEQVRRPVRLSTACDPSSMDVLLEYSPRELRALLRGIKLRKTDEALQASDPARRPLMPISGEQVPESGRA